MPNEPRIEIEIVRLSTAIAELRLRANIGGEMRGRLMGPRSPQGGTLEVAYPIKSMTDSAVECVGSVLIPEPNQWDSDRQFTYGGPVEIWQNGKTVHAQWVEIGLKQKS